MIKLLVLFRALNLYTHHAHNIAKGDEFFQDHVFFGDIYDLADKLYDDVIEREIGTNSDKISLLSITHDVSKEIMHLGSDHFNETLKLIGKIIKEIDSLTKSGKLSIGTQNLIAGQADELEVISYKIKRRILEDEVV